MGLLVECLGFSYWFGGCCDCLGLSIWLTICLGFGFVTLGALVFWIGTLCLLICLTALLVF